MKFLLKKGKSLSDLLDSISADTTTMSSRDKTACDLDLDDMEFVAVD